MKLTLYSKVLSRRQIERVFQLQFVVADNYTTGGMVVDFTQALNPKNADRARIPAFVDGIPVAGSPTALQGVPPAAAFTVKQVPQGYDLEIIVNPVNPSLKNYLFKITSSGGAELAAAGIPAGIYNDVNGFTFSCTTPQKYG